MKLVLASQSPRRRELLLAAGIDHVVRAAEVDETPHPDEPPVNYVRRLAEFKASAVMRLPEEIILGADTAVVCYGQILGKPADAAHAGRMLRLLAGRSHEVITGVALLRHNEVRVEHAITQVWFGPMTEAEIEAYIESGEPMDKAGAYGIQGIASRYITRIDGSYSNVVGLPVELVWRMLNESNSTASAS